MNTLTFWSLVTASVVGWIVLLFVLHKFLRSKAKKRLIITTTFIGGLIYVLQFFLPEKSPIFFFMPQHNNPFTPMIDFIGVAALVVGGFTFMLGVINLISVHGKTVLRHRAGWYNSAAFFVALFAMGFFGLWAVYGGDNSSFDRTAKMVNSWLFEGALVSLDATMFSLLAFYMAAAAFRAFRLRSSEATVLVVAAFLVMLGQVPVGVLLTSWLPTEGWQNNFRIENIALWLLGVVNMSGLRAVNFGIGVGALAMSLRLWLNLERGAFFEQEF